MQIFGDKRWGGSENDKNPVLATEKIHNFIWKVVEHNKSCCFHLASSIKIHIAIFWFCTIYMHESFPVCPPRNIHDKLHFWKKKKVAGRAYQNTTMEWPSLLSSFIPCHQLLLRCFLDENGFKEDSWGCVWYYGSKCTAVTGGKSPLRGAFDFGKQPHLLIH